MNLLVQIYFYLENCNEIWKNWHWSFIGTIKYSRPICMEIITHFAESAFQTDLCCNPTPVCYSGQMNWLRVFFFSGKKDCLPPLIDSGLAKNKWPELARQVLRGFSATFKFTNQSRCNYGERTSVFGCSATGIDSGKGLFRYYLPASINNGTFKFFRTFFTGSRLKLAYVTCFARLIVNRTFLGETHDYGFVQLSRSRIIAKIDGKNTVIKGTKYAHFNARNSYDTIQRWNLYHGLTFSWKCESNGEDVPVLDNSSKEYPMLKITTPFVNVKIDVAKLKAGVNYTLTLFVSRGRKNALVRKLVVVYDEAFFNLR